LLRLNHPNVPLEGDVVVAARRKIRPIVWAGAAVAVMVVLTPLGSAGPRRCVR